MYTKRLWQWVPWAVNRAMFAAGVALSWKCREIILPAYVLAALWMALVPLPAPASADTGRVDMQHIVLVSHFREGSFVVNRTLDSVNRAARMCRHPVRVIHACEEKSNIRRGLVKTVAMPDVAAYERRIHPANTPGENAGLGSNLRYAIAAEILSREERRAKGTLRDSPHVMVTKLDGNAVVPESYLLDLESAWFLEDLSPNVSFQPFIREHGMQEDDLAHWTLKASTLGNVTLNEFTFQFLNALSPGFHSSYSMPLSMIEAAGSWDPLLVQEDQLMGQRAALALPMFRRNAIIDLPMAGFRKILLNTTVYNAPVLSFQDLSAQGIRCMLHGWKANDSILSQAMRVSVSKTLTSLPLKYFVVPSACLGVNPVAVYLLAPSQFHLSALFFGTCVYLVFRRLPEDREPRTPAGKALFRLQRLAMIVLSQTMSASYVAISNIIFALHPPTSSGIEHYHTTSTM